MGRYCHFIGFFLLALTSQLAWGAATDSELSASLSVPQVTSLRLTSFSISDAAVAEGQPATFLVTVHSVGNVVAEFRAAVHVFHEGGGLADNFTYVDSTIAGGEVQALSKSRGGLAHGKYVAYANVTYGPYSTGTMNLSFKVVGSAGSVIGNATRVRASGISSPRATISGTEAQDEGLFNGTQRVRLLDGAEELASFDYDFSSANLDFWSMEISSGSTGGRAFLALSGAGAGAGSKTFWIRGASGDYNGICVKDAENQNASDITSACNGPSEFAVRCDGSPANGVSCTRDGSTLAVSGLQHSAVMQFQVAAEAGQAASSSSGGTQSTVSPKPSPVLPLPKMPQVSQPQETGDLMAHMLQFSAFGEASAGTSLLITSLVENPGSGQLSLDVDVGGMGLPPVQAEGLVLGPGERRAVPFTVDIPPYMRQGYYVFQINLSSGGRQATYPMIIRLLPPVPAGTPEIRRRISLDYERNETLVILSVANNGRDPIEHLQVYDSLPATLAHQAQSVRFVSRPSGGEFSQLAPARWDLTQLQPYEKRSIVYGLPGLLAGSLYYEAWPFPQLISIEPGASHDITLTDLSAPSLPAGGSGTIVAGLFNAGSSEREVRVDVLAPEGWEASPSSMSLSLPSRASQELEIAVQAPKSARAGTYGFTMRLGYDETLFDRQVFVYVSEPSAGYYAPPLAAQLLAWLAANLPTIVLAAAILIAAAAACYFAYRKLTSPHYDSGRVAAIKRLGRMMKRSSDGRLPPG